MTCHWDFSPRSEYAYPNRVRAACGRDDKGRLAEVHFMRERLHLGGSELSGVMKHRELIASEGMRSKYVDESEGDSLRHSLERIRIYLLRHLDAGTAQGN